MVGGRDFWYILLLMDEKKKIELRFPKKFLWGASISTHQVEGGNHNQWTSWELETARVKAAQAHYMYSHLTVWDEIKDVAKKPSNYVSAKATDHFNKYILDFEIAKKLHFSALRSGVEWSRIEPKEGEFDRAAIEHYKAYFLELKKRNISAVITLWHWSLPDWFAKKGGFEKRSNVKYFVRYVETIMKELAPLCSYVITINEPTVYAAMSYHEGRWPPEGESKTIMLKVLLNLARAHKKSYKVIKRINADAAVGLAHNCAYYYAGDDSWISKTVAWLGHYFSNEFFINRIRRYQDFFGLNFYFTNRVIGTRVHNPNTQVNDLGWDMQPDRLRPLLNQLFKKYKLPIMVTESGVADMHDQYRKWWILESVKAMNLAIKDGTEMIGYIHWSLLDNFEWAEGFWPRFGLVEVNYKTLQRKVRPSALWYGRLIKSFRS